LDDDGYQSELRVVAGEVETDRQKFFTDAIDPGSARRKVLLLFFLKELQLARKKSGEIRSDAGIAG
jgi:hypothetical protein